MRVLMVAIFLSVIPTILHATNLCDTGYYLATGGGCAICPGDSYCPGDDRRYVCPRPETYRRTTFPAEYYNPTITETTLADSPGRTTLADCSVLNMMESDRGTLYEYAAYNPATEKYDISRGYNWRAARPGYYLTRPTDCNGWADYGDAVECPAGSYCPGRDATRCNAENKATVHTETFGLETCPKKQFSAPGAAECSACPTGTYSDGGATECTACPDPKTHMRTTFPDFYYENPSIQHTYPNGVHSNLNECSAIVALTTQRGQVFDYARYNPKTEKYDITYNSLWYTAAPGYYLKSPNACDTYAYYSEAVECPAGSYCPGKDWVICTPENKDTVHTPTFGLEKCPTKTYSNTGADSVDACIACPDPKTHMRTTFPDYYYENPQSVNVSESGSAGGDITTCFTQTTVTSDRGTLFDRSRYNPETDEYDLTYYHMWYSVKPGYYLTTPTSCGTYAYYDDAVVCPAGAYCPGKERVVCNAENKATVHTKNFGRISCPEGTYSDTMGATDASVCQSCPDPDTHKRTTFPDYYYENPVILTITHQGTATRLDRCVAITRIETDRGVVIDYANYNPETEKYDNTTQHLWHSVKPGYYLATPGACGTYAYYVDAHECPAGAYCPGKNFVVCNAENKDEVHTPTFGLETCPAGTYSATTGADDVSVCQPCPAGTYGTAGATAISGCKACAAGSYSAPGAAECTKCPNGTYSDAGGTGADACVACPDPATHKRTTFPDSYYENPVVIETRPNGAGIGAITACEALTTIESDRGVVIDYVRYNPETEQYDNTYHHMWRSVKPGYYLAQPSDCTGWAYYKTVAKCPTGAYCPGKDAVVCNAENKDEVLTTTFGQERCPDGTYNDTTGASECTPCPDPKTHARTTFPDNYYVNPVIHEVKRRANSNFTNISGCNATTTVRSDQGEVFDYAHYNPDTEQYDKTYLRLWHRVYPGYYLITPSSCGTYAYYKDAMECPAGSYCPGKATVYCNAENKAEVHTPTFGLETCPANTYSDAGASSCSACPTGTGNSGTAALGNVGAASCMPLCPGGLTKLNVAGRKFNLWPRSQRTSPALCTDVNDNVCCVNMAPGNGPGINVELHNQVYHTTN